MITEDRILYVDNHIIAINKLPSEIVQGDKTGDKPLSEDVKDWIKYKYNKPGDAFIGVIHRIDRPVSGAVLFARTSKGLSRLNELIRARELHKKYWAIVKGCPENEQGHLTNYLLKNEKTNKSFIHKDDSKGALLSELKYNVLIKGDNYSLLEIDLMTGRHHQIRAQLANIGCPIKGDLKYGSNRSNPDGSISLHARSIEFTHPITHQDVMIIAEPPTTDKLWHTLIENIEVKD